MYKARSQRKNIFPQPHCKQTGNQLCGAPES